MDADFLVTPRNTTEFYALIEEAQKMHQAMHAQDRMIAAELKKRLQNPKGKKFVAHRLDLRMNAYRVTKHFVSAGAANIAAAKAYRVAYTTYLDLYTNQSAHTGTDGFDVDK